MGTRMRFEDIVAQLSNTDIRRFAHWWLNRHGRSMQHVTYKALGTVRFEHVQNESDLFHLVYYWRNAGAFFSVVDASALCEWLNR